MIRFDDILEKVASYLPNADLGPVRKAYVFSAQVHHKQVRLSGEPYLVHPLGVASILADLRCDVPSVATGLLHDTVEDTLTTLDELEKLFGSEIKSLVDGVTKVSRLALASREERQAENFRKMLVAMAKDFRVLLVKLADRLDNMRSLAFLPEERRAVFAQETLDIYAPISNRLGIFWMKSELEDAAFKHLRPDVCARLEQRLAERRGEREAYIEGVKTLLRDMLAEHGIRVETTGRIKHLYSLYQKMERQRLDLDQVHDLVAFRVIVGTVRECYEALGVIHSRWKPVAGRFKDYIAMPKANLYQSLHTTVIGPRGERMEVQIRTEEMHRVAEQGIAAHWKYKEGRLVEDKDDARFNWLRHLMELQQEMKDPGEFLDTVRTDLFADSVYVFTPRGEVKEFPKGSTPIDFAYSVHTDLGHHCGGARVNGKLVQLASVLRNGDTVEILESASAHPSKDWLKIAATSSARSKIRQWFKRAERERSVTLGRDILDRECRRFDLTLERVTHNGDLERVAQEMNLRDEEALLSSLGYGKVTALNVLKRLVPSDRLVERREEDQSMLRRIFRRAMGKVPTGVTVEGMEDILVRFGKCCRPLPGDPIVGFITRGRGVTVHASTCSLALGSDADRRVQVAWAAKPGVVRPVRIQIVCTDRPGLLAQLSSSISTLEVNIKKAEVRTTKDQKAVGTFEVQVRDASHLRNVFRSVEKVPGVISVERLHP